MITFWQQENNKLIHLEREELDLGKKTWIDARSVTRDDIKILEEEYHVSQEHILDILDQDEMSRIEPDDEYTLFIFRLPLFNPENDAINIRWFITEIYECFTKESKSYVE